MHEGSCMQGSQSKQQPGSQQEGMHVGTKATSMHQLAVTVGGMSANACAEVATHPLSRFSARMRSTTVLCQSSVPWHMLRRATFMPCTARASSIASLQVAGPMVATIFVRRVLLKPGHARVQMCVDDGV